MHSSFSCEPRFVAVENIYLDIENPRFSSTLEAHERGILNARSQEIARRELMQKHGARSLMESIARLGFLTVDRIVLRKVDSQNFVVVEGNRRIAAIKTLKRHARLGIAQVPDDVLYTIEQIEALVVSVSPNDTSCATLLLQGVRHISGVRSWGPYQQGRLVHNLISNSGMNFKEAALSVGLSASRVSTLLRGYQCMVQMMEHPVYGAACTPDMFSYFEQAYLKIPVRDWLGWENSFKKFMNLKQLEFFYSLITSSVENPPKLLARDVRDKLPQVLLNESACKAFCESKDINAAYSLTRSGVDILDPFLESAKGFLQEANQVNLSMNRNDLKLIEKLHAYTGRLIREQAAY